MLREQLCGGTKVWLHFFRGPQLVKFNISSKQADDKRLFRLV